MLAQHTNDLILGKSASPHRSSPSDELTYQWYDFWGAGHFNEWSQHSFFKKKECGDRAAPTDILLGIAAGGDPGSLAPRGIDELDQARLRSGFLLQFLGAVAVVRHSTAGSEAIMVRAQPDGRPSRLRG
jgi:hypothetical protein